MKQEKFAENGRTLSIQPIAPRATSWRILEAFMPTVGDIPDAVRLMRRAAAQNFNALCISGEKNQRNKDQTNALYNGAAENGLVLFEECLFDAHGYELDKDEKIDDFITHAVIPHITRMRDHAIATHDRDSTLNVYLPHAERLLRREWGWRAGHIWYKIARVIVPLCQSKNGAMPEFIIETPHEPDLYAPVIQSFPDAMRGHLHHTTNMIPGMIHDTTCVFDMIKNVARHNYHGAYHRYHRDRMTLGTAQIGVTGGAILPDYLCNGLYDAGDYMAARKIILAATTLPTPGHMLKHGENQNHFYRPCDPVAAKKLELGEVDTDGDAKRFVTDLNDVKEKLYDLHDGYFWNEMAFSWAVPTHALQIFWPKPGFMAEPVFVLIDTHKAGQERDIDPARVISDLYQQNVFDKRHPYIRPQAIVLLGPHGGLDQDRMTEKYGPIPLFHNNNEVYAPSGQQIAYKPAPSGLYNTPKVA